MKETEKKDYIPPEMEIVQLTYKASVLNDGSPLGDVDWDDDP